MKQFYCGDVVPGCTARFQAQSEDGILQQVADHARTGHGITDVSPELVSAVRSHIQEVAHQ